MQTMRESWTDERLDDLKGSMNERFDQVETRFKQVDARFDRVESDISELRKTMTQGFIALATITTTSFFSLAGLLIALLVSA
ncbi:MAG TPA: hypothetical protein VIT89_09315 [Solirubrobacterales bacterium]